MTSAETSPGGTTQTANGSSDIEQLQTQIEQTREELAETLDALGAKLDVKSRAKAKVRSTTEQARAGVEVGRDHVVQVTSKAVNAATDRISKAQNAVRKRSSIEGTDSITTAITFNSTSAIRPL